MHIEPKLSHDDLARSLAGHLRADRRMTWCDMQLGAAGSVRPDVYTIQKSYSNPCPVVYECKVSISDFRSDVTSGKWQSYLPYASAVYFACEAGLIAKADVPAHCGLMLFADGRWRAAKRAITNAVTIPQDALLKLIIDGVEREGPRHRAAVFDGYTQLKAAEARFGAVLAKAVQDRLAVDAEIDHAERQAKRIIEDAKRAADKVKAESLEKVEPLRAELCAVLGLQPNADRWQIEVAIRALRESLQQHPTERQLKRLTNSLRVALEAHGFKEVAKASEARQPDSGSFVSE